MFRIDIFEKSLNIAQYPIDILRNMNYDIIS